VAECEGQIVGFVALAPSRDADASVDTAEVGAMYVHPDDWRRGVGRALMTSAVDELRRAGFHTATLWVLDTNQRGDGFYRAVGWHPDGATKRDVVGRESERHPGVEVTEVRYRITLDAAR
jgi:GNAT superfamily N-acetyltransferase